MNIPDRIDFSYKECAFFLMARFPGIYSNFESAHATIRIACRSGKLKAVRVAGKARIPRAEIARYLGVQ